MAHPSYKRPESVLVVVAARSGEVLLLERREPRGFWQSVTGSLRWGETPPAAAARELAEETGIVDTRGLRDCRCTNRFPILPQWRARYEPTVQENTEYVFALTLDSPCAVTLNPTEHVAWRWLPRAEAAARVSSYTNRDAILVYVVEP